MYIQWFGASSPQILRLLCFPIDIKHLSCILSLLLVIIARRNKQPPLKTHAIQYNVPCRALPIHASEALIATLEYRKGISSQAPARMQAVAAPKTYLFQGLRGSATHLRLHSQAGKGLLPTPPSQVGQVHHLWRCGSWRWLCTHLQTSGVQTRSADEHISLVCYFS